MPAKSTAVAKNRTQRASVHLDLEEVLSPAGLAQQLAAAAAALSDGLESGRNAPALEHNLELWVAIRALATRQNGQLDPGVRDSLLKAADAVATITFGTARGFSPETVMQLIKIDLELAKGLSNAMLRQMTSDRAYSLWQKDGCRPENDQHYWFAAEAEIRGAMTPR